MVWLVRILAACFLLGVSYIGMSLSVSKVDRDLVQSDGAVPSGAVDATPAKDGAFVQEHNSAVVSGQMNMTLLGSEWVLWLLIILSIATGAVIMERSAFFYKDRINFDQFMHELTTLLKQNDTSSALKHCREFDAFEARVGAEGFSSEEFGIEGIEKGISGYIARQRTLMDRGLMFLGTLGNNAPFIGLFGTVLGIIQAFNSLSLNPAGGPSVVMGGISEALVATAVGLFVAIPAVIAFNWFQRIISQKLSNAEAIQDLVLKHYAGEASKKSAAA